MYYAQPLLGVAIMIGMAWLLSERRRRLPWGLIWASLALQVFIAVLLLRVPVARDALFALNGAVRAIDAATEAGTSFVFGYLGGGAAPFQTVDPSRTFVFAFRVLPQILILSVLVAILWYWRVLPLVVRAFAAVLRRVLGVGGAVGVGASASIFLGMVETPLIIRPYLARLSRGELFALMTCGMSTIAGSVMVLFATILGPLLPAALGHILIASAMSIPAAILFAVIMVPIEVHTEGEDVADALQYHSTMDAISRGTTDGVHLVINVGAMLVVLISLIALINGFLSALPPVADQALTLQRVLGWAFAPLAWLMGISWAMAPDAGALLGTKLILNELVAYVDMAELPDGTFDARTTLILTYALCGFANFGSLGIMIGGLGAMCPERRNEVLGLGPKTLISGTLACCMTGAIVGVID